FFVNNISGLFPFVAVYRRWIALLVSSSRERREDLEGENIPPRRYAAPPKFKACRADSLRWLI
ncbi:MAG: hypothetical protein JSW13_01160, partial [Candidatus Aerophobus sp.]